MQSAAGGYELSPYAIATSSSRVPLLFSSKGQKVPLFAAKSPTQPPKPVVAAEQRVAAPSKPLYLLGRGEYRRAEPGRLETAENISATQSRYSESGRPAHSRELFEGRSGSRGKQPGVFTPLGAPTTHLQPSLLLSRQSGLFPVSELSEADKEPRSGAKGSARLDLQRSQAKQAADELDEYKVDHLKTVVDKLYGPVIDPAVEYPPGLSSAGLYRDILLEAEQKKAQQLLFVQQKRRLNIMNKLAQELEKDLKIDADRVDTFTDNIEKEIKSLEVESKKRTLEILQEDIDEQVKADQQRIEQLDRLEAEMNLSELIKQNEEVIKLAESDLARGLITKEQKLSMSTVKKNQSKNRSQAQQVTGKKVSQITEMKKPTRVTSKTKTRAL